MEGPGTNHHQLGMAECRKRIADMTNRAKRHAGISEETPLSALVSHTITMVGLVDYIHGTRHQGILMVFFNANHNSFIRNALENLLEIAVFHVFDLDSHGGNIAFSNFRICD